MQHPEVQGSAPVIPRGITMVLHGESGVGKSWLADTAPAPRLVLDAEGGTLFTPSEPKVWWDPVRQTPPAADGWQTCVVNVRDFQDVEQVKQWLLSGQHPFRSVVIDSLTEVQKRCLDRVVGVNMPQTQDWGTLLRQMESLVRIFRDLRMHPTKPLESVIFICLSSSRDGSGHQRPHLQGQLGITLPGFVDVVGYLFTQADEQGTRMFRRLLVQPYKEIVAKDRTGRLGMVVEEPHIERIIAQVYGQTVEGGVIA